MKCQEFIYLLICLTIFLGQSTSLTDAVACQVAENGIDVVLCLTLAHFLLDTLGGAFRQPAGETPPSGVLLTITSANLRLQVLLAESSPESLTQSPRLLPVTEYT